ncbi:MAG: hypothetical protein VZQ81_04905 [Succiniclasticum sp.]|jgi:hypothetical protein|nr:hypothetical protein [Succiniclasticum sp.]MEE3479344.1 hypothetical protein [Succiniclasticum sp.]
MKNKYRNTLGTILSCLVLLLCCCAIVQPAEAKLHYYNKESPYAYLSSEYLVDTDSIYMYDRDSSGFTVLFDLIAPIHPTDLFGAERRPRCLYVEMPMQADTKTIAPGAKIYPNGDMPEYSSFRVCEVLNPSSLRDVAQIALTKGMDPRRSGEARGVPNRLVIPRELEYEELYNPLEYRLVAAKEVPLRAASDSASAVVASLAPNEDGDIIDYALVVYPRRHPYTYKGQRYNFLFYNGEGYYYIWKDGTVTSMLMEGGDRKYYSPPECWFQLRKADGTTGWVRMQGTGDWQEDTSHVTVPKPRICHFKN